MSCVPTPAQTVFSTPVTVGTITRPITTLVTVPGAVVTETTTVITANCGSGPVVSDDGPHNAGSNTDGNSPNDGFDHAGGAMSFVRRQSQGDCTSVSIIVRTEAAQTITSVTVTDELTTAFGDPIPIATQPAVSCPDISPTPTPTPGFTSGVPATTNSTSLSSPSSSATQDGAAPSHKSTNVGVIAGGAAAGVVALLLLFFLFCKIRQKRARRGIEKDTRPDPEKGGTKGQLSNHDDPFATPAGEEDQDNVKSRDSDSSNFETGADQPATNTIAAALSATGPISERAANSIATDKIPPKPASSAPGATAADQPATNTLAAALSAVGPTSEKAANSIATDKIPTKSASSAPKAAGADQPAANPVAAALSASGPTSEKMAALIAKDKIRANSTSSAKTKSPPSAAGPARSLSLSQAKSESSSSTPQPADPPQA